MRYTLTVPTPPPPPISASSSGSGWPWWAWALLLAAVMAIAAASLLAPWNRWFGRVERWAFWRREWVRDRVRDHRGLVYLYAGLDAAARHTAITNTRTGLLATLAVLGAGVGLAYTARTYRLSREGHLTDRYTKAVEQLGSDKIEVRLGGIYALERLLRDSSTDQPTIVEVLAAYIRQHAPLSHPALAVSAAPAPSASTRPRLAGARRAPRPVQPDQPDADVQAALTVLGRRTAVAAENPIDLTGTHLAGAQLDWANLTDARLIEANLTGAWLDWANLAAIYVPRGALTEEQLAGASNVELIEWEEE